MTLVSTIIADAYRESNLIAAGESPSAAQEDEALRLLNRIVSAVYGYEAGENLQDVLIQEWNEGYRTPNNHRFLFNLSGHITFKMPAKPRAGSRVILVDLGGNFATNPLTVDGNGRKVAGATTQTYNDSLEREFFYNAKTGSWDLVEALGMNDELPFPERFDDYFVIGLAMRLNPRHGIQTDPVMMAAYNKARSQLRSAYVQIQPTVPEFALMMVRPKESGTEWEHYPDIDDAL